MRRHEEEPPHLPWFFLASFSAAAARSWLNHRRASAALRRIRAAPSARVSDLRSLLSDVGGGGVLVALRGPALCRPSLHVLPRVREASQSLVHELFPHVAIFSWPSDHYRTLMNDSVRVPAELVPLAFVEGDQGVNITMDRTCPLPRDLVQRLIPEYQFTEYPDTLLQEEKSVPIVMEITALGICTNRDGALKIELCRQLPYFLSDMTKDEIEASLTTSTRNYCWATILLGGFTIGILGKGFFRLATEFLPN